MEKITFEPTPEQAAALTRLRKDTGMTTNYLLSRAVDELLVNGSTMTREPNEETLQAFADVEEGRDLKTYTDFQEYLNDMREN